MELFTDENLSGIFSPLASPNRELYYGCMKRIIEMSKEQTVVYEDEARLKIQYYLKNKTLVDEEGCSYSREDAYTKTVLIINHFRKKGWLAEREVGPDGDYIISVPNYIRRLMRSIDDIFFKDKSNILPNLLINIFHSLKYFVEEQGTDRYYDWGIRPIYDLVMDLQDELSAMKGNIHTIRQYILQQQTIQSLNRVNNDDQMIQKFFDNYRAVRKGGLFVQYINKIRDYLRRIDEGVLKEKIIWDYARSNPQESAAPEVVIDTLLYEMISYFDYGYEDAVEDIDRRLDEFYKIWNTKLTMIAQHGTDRIETMERLLNAMKNTDEETRNSALEAIGRCFHIDRYKILGNEQGLRTKKARNNQTAPVIPYEVSEETKKRKVHETKMQNSSKYNEKMTARYINHVMKQKDEVTLDKDSVKTQEDLLYIVSGAVKSSDRDFPYEVKMTGNTIENEYAVYSELVFKKKKDGENNKEQTI